MISGVSTTIRLLLFFRAHDDRERRRSVHSTLLMGPVRTVSELLLLLVRLLVQVVDALPLNDALWDLVDLDVRLRYLARLRAGWRREDPPQQARVLPLLAPRLCDLTV